MREIGAMRAFRAAIIPPVILSAWILATTAAAEPMTNDMDLVYGRYHMAIRAAELCRGVTPDDGVWRKWSSYLDSKTDHELGAGERLSVLEGAKSDATGMVRRQGCYSIGVQHLLVLYDSELAGMAGK